MWMIRLVLFIAKSGNSRNSTVQMCISFQLTLEPSTAWSSPQHTPWRSKGGEQKNSSTLSLTSELDGGGWSTPGPGRFEAGKNTRYPLYRTLGGHQGLSGQVRKIWPPPVFDPQAVHPLPAWSLRLTKQKQNSSPFWDLPSSNTSGPGSSVGIATGYGMPGPGSNPGGDGIFRPSRPALWPTQSPVQWVPGLSRW